MSYCSSSRFGSHREPWQLREALPGDQDYQFLLHDRHATFSPHLDEEVERWGIQVLRSPARTPANAHCERLIGTIRRECLDYLIPPNERHLRRTLHEWTGHYNAGRRHQSLGPGIPDRAQDDAHVCDKSSRLHGAFRVISKQILGGLHHEYRRGGRMSSPDWIIAEHSPSRPVPY